MVQHGIAIAASAFSAAAAGAAMNFALNKYVAFRDRSPITGHQLARYMRERYLDIKVLYLSGYREQLFKEKGSLWADEAFLDKPCTPQQLTEAVARLLFGLRADSKPDKVDR